MTDRPNAADVLTDAIGYTPPIGGLIGSGFSKSVAERRAHELILALRAAVGVQPLSDDVVCLLPDGTLSVAEPSGWNTSKLEGIEPAHKARPGCQVVGDRCRPLFVIPGADK